MANATYPLGDGTAVNSGSQRAGGSVASWPAIIAGAFVAVATSLILMALGAGLGFAETSPWAGHGVSATTFAVTTAIWLIVTQWISACLGGYIAGRLRARWIGTHTHEIFFRDTAHGLVTWAVSTVIVAAILGASTLSLVRGGLHAAGSGIAAVAQGGAAQAPADGPRTPGAMYGADKLFRAGSGAAEAKSGTQDPRGEAMRVMENAIATGSVPDGDRTYLAELVASRTGISQAEAQKRVNDWITASEEAQVKIKAAADTARKEAAEAAIYLSLSLLIGAFIASVSAALGGHLRDEHP